MQFFKKFSSGLVKLRLHIFKTQSREQMASSIREETVQSCRSVHPVRRLHHSTVTVLALLISSPWLRLLAAISSLQHFLPLSELAAPPVRSGRTKVEKDTSPTPGSWEGATSPPVHGELWRDCRRGSTSQRRILTERSSAVDLHPFFSRKAFPDQSCVLQIKITGLVVSKTSSQSRQRMTTLMSILVQRRRSFPHPVL